MCPSFFDGVAISKESGLNVATWNITTRTMTGTAPDRIQVDGKPLGFYHFTGFDSGAHGIMADRNAAGNDALHALIAWYRGAIEVAEGDRIAELPWAFGCYSDGEPIEPGHRRIYGMRASLQKAYPDPFDAAPPAFAAWIEARGAAAFPEFCGDAADRMPALEAENRRLKEELHVIKTSLSWRLSKPIRALF